VKADSNYSFQTHILIKFSENMVILKDWSGQWLNPKSELDGSTKSRVNLSRDTNLSRLTFKTVGKKPCRG